LASGISCVACTTEQSADAKSSFHRCVTGVDFVEKLRRLMKVFPHGLPVAKLAAEYKVMFTVCFELWLLLLNILDSVTCWTSQWVPLKIGDG